MNSRRFQATRCVAWCAPMLLQFQARCAVHGTGPGMCMVATHLTWCLCVCVCMFVCSINYGPIHANDGFVSGRLAAGGGLVSTSSRALAPGTAWLQIQLDKTYSDVAGMHVHCQHLGDCMRQISQGGCACSLAHIGCTCYSVADLMPRAACMEPPRAPRPSCWLALRPMHDRRHPRSPCHKGWHIP